MVKLLQLIQSVFIANVPADKSNQLKIFEMTNHPLKFKFRVFGGMATAVSTTSTKYTNN